jgi:hypothetical protein
MRLFDWCIKHNWTPVYIEAEYKFMKQTLKELVKSDMRICQDCLKVQKRYYSGPFILWKELTDQEMKVFIKGVEYNKDLDKWIVKEK